MISKKILKWLEENNILELTSIQKKAIPVILKGKNVLITAPTGYGKTLAVIIPIFNQLIRMKIPGLKMLYIAPTKSLNRDIFKRVFDFAEHLGLRIGIRYGDTSSYEKSKQIRNPPDILITTPESLQSMLISRNMRENLKSLKFVVVDEIHDLVSSKRGAQLSLGLERLSLLSDFSRIGISATISDMKEVGRFLCGDRNFEIVDVGEAKKFKIEVVRYREDKSMRDAAANLNISLALASCIKMMKEDIDNADRTIVFVNTRQQAEILSFSMSSMCKDLKVGLHHSSLSKKQRIRAENDLKEGRIKALIATSSMELGIDVGSVDLVIQFMSPRQVNRLVQRVGRSGHRFYKESRGKIYTINNDDYLESLAIVKLLKKGFLEKPDIPMNALDVLAHQIIGFIRDDSSIPAKKLLKFVNRSACFDMDEARFFSFLQFLQSLNYLSLKGGRIVLTKKAFFYYFRNVSTIPDIKNYRIIDVGTNAKIGTLHESFVVQYCSVGSKIIMKGEPWEILDIGEDSISVAKSKSFSAAVPSWSGELIPVSREVAELVGEMRKEFYKGTFVPDSKAFYVERFENSIIFHSCFGSKINDTFGIVFSSLIGARLGRSIGIRTDPYRVIITTPHGFSLNSFKELMGALKSDMLFDIIRLSVRNTTMFHLRFFNVAQRFGIIRKGAGYIGSYIDKIINLYANTPIFEETLNEIMRDKTDVEAASKLLDSLAVVYSKSSRLSEIGYNGINHGAFSGIFKNAENMEELYELVKERLLNKRFFFKCMNCGYKFGAFSVRDFPYDKCPKCSARTIGFAPLGKEDDEKLLKESAELFLAYGKTACFVLAGYGIGMRNGKRVLANSANDKDMIRRIIDEEKKFVRTRRFWS